MAATQTTIDNFKYIPQELRDSGRWIRANGKKAIQTYSTDEDKAAHMKPFAQAFESKRPKETLARLIDKSEGLVFVDLDKVRNADTGEVQEWAATLIEWLDTYTEISGSGSGFHLVARGSLPEDYVKDYPDPHRPGHTKGVPIELKSGNVTNRLFTLTGNVYCVDPTIQNRQQELEQLLQRCKAGEFGGPASAPDLQVPLLKGATENDKDMPEACLDGWLGEVCRTRMGDFPLAYAWPALLVAASVLVPRETRSRCNLFVDLDGPIHSGKSCAFEKAFHLMSVTKPALMALKTGSAEGLAEYTGETGGEPRLLYPDELAHLLEKSMIERSSLPRFLTTAFYQDEQILTVAKRKVVTFNARLSLAGGTVDNEFGDLFGHATTGGLHDRFLFGKCPSGYQYLWQDFTVEDPAFVLSTDDSLFGLSAERPVPVAADGSVLAERNRWIKEVGIQPRVAEICLRVAVIGASFDSRRTLTAEMLGPALELAKYQNRVRVILQPNPGENPDARCAFAIRNWLTRNAPQGQWVARRVLYLGIHAARLGPGVFDRALRNMVFNGEIETGEVGRAKPVRLLFDPEIPA